jgi:hypothetical protein
LRKIEKKEKLKKVPVDYFAAQVAGNAVDT